MVDWGGWDDGIILGHCAHCGARQDPVRPGKVQATCDCCQVCGTPGYGYYHEDDSPFEMCSGWLCLSCHLQHHYPLFGLHGIKPEWHDRIRILAETLKIPMAPSPPDGPQDA